jgi:8-oxo-dGTP pyrophosphatase MutT (NUDIX family)
MELFWKDELGWEDQSGGGDFTWLQEIFLFEPGERTYSSVHAFSFVDNEHIVLGHHSGNGHYGNLGGAIEAGENLEQALRREIKEEGNAELVRWAPVLLVRHIKKSEGWDNMWQAWGWADVTLLPGDKYADVGGDVDGREIVAVSDVPAKLGWGEEKLNMTIKAMLEDRARTR